MLMHELTKHQRMLQDVALWFAAVVIAWLLILEVPRASRGWSRSDD